MSASPGAGRRDLLPRWRPAAAALRSGELNSLLSPSQRPKNQAVIGELEASFSASPGIFTASDLVSGSIVAEVRTNAGEIAARSLLDHSDTPSPARLLAQRLLDGEVGVPGLIEPPELDPDVLRSRIAKMRKIIRNEPQNAMRWADLALAHANVGDRESAAREIEISHNLAPNSRHILRSAARLFLLTGEPDRAHRILTSAERLEQDPWLQAAEISVASTASLRPQSVRIGLRFVKAQTLQPWHLSELASELATLQFRAGNSKRARQLLRLSLVAPTENALAQAEWSAAGGLSEAVPDADLRPGSFEARAVSLGSQGKFEDAIESAILWQADQPFAVEPAIFACYLASTGIQDFDKAIMIAKRGLRTNPSHGMLRNNLAFALILNGQVEEGAAQVQSLLRGKFDGLERSTVLATAGLLAFRSGLSDQGRQFYQQATTLMTKRDPRARALLQLFWAQEEIRQQSQYAESAFSEAESRASGVEDASVQAVFKRVQHAHDQSHL